MGAVDPGTPTQREHHVREHQGGVEKGHYEVSVAIVETHLLPAVRAKPDATVLADGMSCRIQLDDLAGVPALHLAELLAIRIGA